MTQKILAAHAGMDHVEAGQLIEADLDMVLGNDITSPVAIREFEKYGFKRVFDPGKVAMVMDHFAPNKDIKAAQQCKACRTFAFAKHIEHFYDVGEMGIEHALLPEKGIVGPGECIIGADSHTCTYGALGAFSTGVGSTDMAAGMATGKCWFKVPEAIRFNLSGSLQPNVSGKDVILHIIGMIGVDGALYRSMEFTGEGVKNLTMDDRLCICNMAIEAGAKNGIFEVDDVTRAYVKDRVHRPYQEYHADADAEYVKTYDIDLSAIRPTVAFPHLPENTHPAFESGHIKIDQVVVGSCTNGRLEDLQQAAEVMQGRKVHPHVRAIIIPATVVVGAVICYAINSPAGFAAGPPEDGGQARCPHQRQGGGRCAAGHCGRFGAGRWHVHGHGVEHAGPRYCHGRGGHPSAAVLDSFGKGIKVR